LRQAYDYWQDQPDNYPQFYLNQTIFPLSLNPTPAATYVNMKPKMHDEKRDQQQIRGEIFGSFLA